MRETRNIFFFLGLLVPALLAFKALFLPGSLAWGDAPYFYPEGLQELLSEPYGWVNRGHNFGGINNILWLSPVMFLYGALHALFGLGNDAIVRVLFYFPAVFFAFVGPLFLARYLGASRIVRFFAGLLYGLNTYFLLLIDGGQVGVALAYGIFPLALLSLRKLIDKPHLNNFFLALIAVVGLGIADARFLAISVLTLAVWVLAEGAVNKRVNVRNLRHLIPLGVAGFALSSYWLLPLFKLGQDLNTTVSSLQLVSLLNPLFLFQPHWPLNEFGKVSPPPFYFVGIPLLVFGGLLLRKGKRTAVFAFCFLFFAFLAKGETPPAGQIYSWLLNIPFGTALRDSTKFFAPLLLFGGILLGSTIKALADLKPKFKNLIFGAVFAYLLFLVYPALSGQLNGVLATRTFREDFRVVYENLRGDGGVFRTAWFPERHPLAFHTEEKPALDAKDLVEERPFASLNVGTFDRFNFLHQEEFLDWFDLLGIKYLVFSGEHRKRQLDEKEQENWNKLLELAEGTKGLEQADWNASIPIYKNEGALPRIFGVGKAILVVGSDDVYEKLRGANPEFSVKNQAFIFFEDGKLDPRTLEGLPKDSAILVFNEKEETDLSMSFLQEYFVSPVEAVRSDWAIRGANEYLRWKYEFLINEVETREFDYGKGIAFSTVKGEKISWELPVPADGTYILAARTLQGSGFSWDVSEIDLKNGIHPFTLTNETGFAAVNVVALVAKKDWEEAQQLARNFTGHFQVVNLQEPGGAEELARLTGEGRWQEVGYDAVSPVRYKINIPENVGWLVFSDSYHKSWQLVRRPIDLPSYPFYSMINGFRPRPEWREAEVVFQGQKEVRWGMYWTVVSALSLVIIFLWSKRE